jgi:hypothetical protein
MLGQGGESHGEILGAQAKEPGDSTEKSEKAVTGENSGSKPRYETNLTESAESANATRKSSKRKMKNCIPS